jgi:hypothetical protein
VRYVAGEVALMAVATPDITTEERVVVQQDRDITG